MPAVALQSIAAGMQLRRDVLPSIDQTAQNLRMIRGMCLVHVPAVLPLLDPVHNGTPRRGPVYMEEV